MQRVLWNARSTNGQRVSRRKIALLHARLHLGVPKTGYMIESMVTSTVHNIAELIDGREPSHEPTWNAVCLADFGNSGVAFVALPQIPPRNVSWSSQGRWVHVAKIAFEKYFLRKVRKGSSEPGYERYVMKALGVARLREHIGRA